MVRMPTPVGHAVGGLAAALLSNTAARRPGLSPSLLLASATVAVAPDLDILVGIHRAYTHSIGGVAIVGLAAALALRGRRNARWGAAAIAAAHASHLVLDWLSKDTAPPFGLTILWPFSSTFFMSPITVFGEVSRRYWLTDEFVFGNLKAAVWETFILLPILLVAWIWWSGRTLKKG